MFDPAPHYIPDDKECISKAEQFRERVWCYAKNYKVFSGHRIGMIRKCCNMLEKLQREKKKNIWPSDRQEPIEEFENMFQLLIYAICDRGFLFDDAGYLRDRANVEPPAVSWCESPWQTSVRRYVEFAHAMRRRNYAHLERKALRKHLDEHSKQDREYQTSYHRMSTSKSIEEIKTDIWSFIEIDMREFMRYFRSQDIVQKFVTDKADVEKLARLLDAARQDRLMKKIEPIILFMVLSGKIKCDDIQDSSSIKALLKPNKKLFDADKAAMDCALFSMILKHFSYDTENADCKEHSLFDPYGLIGSLKYVDHLEISDKDYASLAHLCEKCFVEPVNKRELKRYSQPVHGVAVGEILNALFVVFDAQDYADGDTKKPRGWKEAITILNTAQILTVDVNDTASQIMQKLRNRYAIQLYNFVWETFWLITGYTPPPGFDWNPNHGGEGLLKRRFELYAVCDEDLKQVFDEACDSFIKDWDQYSLSPELRFDIAKVRRTFADVKGMVNFEEKLIDKMNLWSMWPQEKMGDEMAEYCWRQYSKVLSPEKEKNLKSLQKYRKIMSYAMAEEAIRQLCADTYARVFRLLASLNQYLWPIT